MRYIEFGQIVNTHGLCGELKIYPHTNREKIILKLKHVYIEKIKYDVEKIAMMKNMFKIKLKGIDTIDTANNFLNKNIYREVTDEEVDISAKNDEYFISDLVGIEVYNESDVYIGKLDEVFETGANDVYKIISKDNEEILLPAIKQVILNIDIKQRKMKIRLMEGLN